MRPAAFTIIVYILFLLTQPCQDIFAAHAPEAAEPSATEISSPADSDDEGTGEDCSPFCICSCRTVPAVGHAVSFVPDVEPIIPINRKELLEYSNPQTNSFASTVWQPPKH